MVSLRFFSGRQRRLGFPGVPRLALFDVHEVQQRAPDHEERRSRRGSPSGSIRSAPITCAKIAGPKIPANFSTTAKKPKNSADRCLRDHAGEERRDSAWVPPCTMPTSTARMKKCVASGHEVAERR